MSDLSQLFPPKPAFTEKQLSDLAGRVFIITGATSGVGLELAKILYSRSATVYVCGRSQKSTASAIEEIHTTTKADGKVSALVFDLANLSTIRPAIEGFLAKESRLDVLFHNAGVMMPPAGSRTVDDYDLEIGTNNLAPFLLTRLLQPLLERTAQSADSGSVRVVWVSSGIGSKRFPTEVHLEQDGSPKQKTGMAHYMQTKACDALLACEWDRRIGTKGVMSVSVHPGLIKTNLQRNMPAVQRGITHVVFKSARHGAYSELYSGLSPNVKGGSFNIPWGRPSPMPCNISKLIEPKAKGPSDAARFYEYCDKETERYTADARVAASS